jgi:TetR/AcrR family transcriptional regulator, regulator of cefoperazone and chloramphenicol sensitivity
MIMEMSLGIQKSNARGEETRNRLLAAAMELFSEKGFAAISTREIAAAAETTLPSIPHHFGSKEGLYQGVLAAISEEMAKRLAPASKRAIDILGRKNASRTERIQAIEALIDTHARALLEGKREWAKLILLEQLQPTEALAPINQVLTEQFIDPIVRLLTTLTTISTADAKLKTMSLVGRALIFRIGRSSILELMGWDDLTPARINKILDMLRAEVRASIGA